MTDSKHYSWHDKTWEKFVSACSNNHLPHALLLTGANGVGKLAFAERMVKSLLCVNPDINTREACNHCQGCNTYDSLANPDFIKIQVLEDKQQIGVDQIRRLSQFLTISRSFDAFKVVLIHPIEKMNQNAANSLLKSLEEPANNTVLILVASNLSYILPTIISRSQLLSIPLPSNDESIIWMKSFFKNKNQLEYIEKAEELLEMTSGGPLLAVTIDDQTLKEKADFGNDIINILDKNNSVIDVAKKWEKYEQSTLLDWQLLWTQSLLKTSYADITYKDKVLSMLKSKVIKEMLWPLYQQLLSNKKIIHTSVNPLMNLESMLLLWSQTSRI